MIEAKKVAEAPCTVELRGAEPCIYRTYGIRIDTSLIALTEGWVERVSDGLSVRSGTHALFYNAAKVRRILDGQGRAVWP